MRYGTRCGRCFAKWGVEILVGTFNRVKKGKEFRAD
jgi:hypothetical protein